MGASVSLRILRPSGPDFPPPIYFYQVFTDARGHFVFHRVPPKNYNLTIGKDGYVQWEKEGTGCLESPEVGIYHLPIQLMRAGVINGRVTDADGEPLWNATVRALGVHYGDGGQQISGSGFPYFTTDDRGDYRIFGLAPGRYVVVVNYAPEATAFTQMSMPPTMASSLELTYPLGVLYPGTRQVSKAKAILVQPGQVVSGIDFRLTARHVYQVSGEISGLSFSKRPPHFVSNVHMRVCGNGPAHWPFALGLAGAVGPAGKFLVRNVLPGCYELHVQQLVPGEEPRIAKLRLQVHDHDISGLHLEAVRPVNIPLQIVVEGSSAAQRPWLSLLSLDGRPVGVMRRQGDSFTLRGIPPGSYRFYVNSFSLPPDAYVESASFDSKNLLTQRLQILPGRPPGILKAVIAMDGAELTGTVAGSQAKLGARTNVVLVPAPPLRDVKWLYKATATDASGHFVLQGIRPGGYTLFAWNGIRYPDRPWFDPEFVEAMQDRGTPLELARGQHEALQLRAVLVPPSEGGLP